MFVKKANIRTQLYRNLFLWIKGVLNNNTMRTLIILILVVNLSITMKAQKTEIIPVTGVFKEIDVEKQNKAISVLLTGDEEMKSTMRDLFFQDQNKWNPPVVYAISKVLFEQGYKDDAVMWFYIAQLRARIDANLCQDESAREAVAILNDKFGSSINEYALKDVKKLKIIVKNAIEFVQKYKPTYDHRWINLHGMWAINGIEKGKELSYPKEKWASIKKKTVDNYYADFEKYVLKK